MVFAFSVGQELEDLLDLAVPHDPAQPNRGGVLEGNHYFQAAGGDFEQVKTFNARADGSTADLLNYSNAMVRVDDLITDLETGNTAHEGHP